MQKKKLFLITGMMRSMTNWKDAIEILKEKFQDFEVIPLDVPGMGIHHALKSPYSIDGNVEFLKKRFEANKGDLNVMLGFSLGGMITSKWTELYPDDIHGIILVNTSFTHLQNPLFRMKPKILPAMSVALFAKGYLREKLLFGAICNNLENKDEIIEKWHEDQIKYPVKTRNIIKQLIAGLTFNSKKLELNLPALVLCSPNDHLVSSKCSTNIAKRYETEIAIHDHAGHDVLNDDPKLVANEIDSWIKRLENEK
jgi:pimeloyl-ACP methyl ester carboxylesterase